MGKPLFLLTFLFIDQKIFIFKNHKMA